MDDSLSLATTVDFVALSPSAENAADFALSSTKRARESCAESLTGVATDAAEDRRDDAPAADEVASRAVHAEPGSPPALSIARTIAAPGPLQIIEALLFSTDAPLSPGRLAELAGVSSGQVPELVEELNQRYESAQLSFRIERIAKGFQMLTLPIFAPVLARLDQQHGQSRLSEAMLETLAIVAYKQPLIRADIEAIRGVACGDGLARLREMGLVKVVGRAEIVGRPMLYGTTKRFLDLFGLADLDDLPPMEALSLKRAAAANAGVSLDRPPIAAAGA